MERKDHYVQFHYQGQLMLACAANNSTFIWAFDSVNSSAIFDNCTRIDFQSRRKWITIVSLKRALELPQQKQPQFAYAYKIGWKTKNYDSIWRGFLPSLRRSWPRREESISSRSDLSWMFFFLRKMLIQKILPYQARKINIRPEWFLWPIFMIYAERLSCFIVYLFMLVFFRS